MATPKSPPPSLSNADLAALEEALRGVRPLGGAAPGPRAPAAGPRPAPPPPPAPTRAAPPAPAATAPPRPAPPPPDDAGAWHDALRGVRKLDGPPPRAARPDARPPAPAPRPPASLAGPAPELLDHLQRQNAALQARAEAAERAHAAIQAHLAEAQAARAAAEADARRARDEAAAAAAELAARAARHDEMQRRLVQLEAEGRDLRAQAEASGAAIDLRSALTARGLKGEAELSAALRALLDARRDGPLYTALSAARPDAFADYLTERLVLLAEGEPAPEGRAVVRVPAERSEARDESAIRDACSRFSTACLVAGKRRIAFVGGSPAYRKQLKEGLDRRLDLRFVEGDARRVPRFEADLVIVWGATELDHSVSDHFPGAVLIPHRGIARMLQMAADRIGA